METTTIHIIKPEVKQALIDYLENEDNYCFFDLNSNLEYLYRLEHGEDVSKFDFVRQKKLKGSHLPVISDGCMQWAGLHQRDPELNVPRYPKSTLLKHIKHTWSTYSVFYDKSTTTRRRHLINILMGL